MGAPFAVVVPLPLLPTPPAPLAENTGEGALATGCFTLFAAQLHGLRSGNIVFAI
jgi:hypothetical protein